MIRVDGKKGIVELTGKESQDVGDFTLLALNLCLKYDYDNADELLAEVGRKVNRYLEGVEK